MNHTAVRPPIVLVLLVIVSALSSPAAVAQDPDEPQGIPPWLRPGPPADETRSDGSEKDRDKDDDARGDKGGGSGGFGPPLDFPQAPAVPTMPALISFALTGVGGILALGTALLLARRAARPVQEATTPFETGRRDAMRRAPATTAEALDALSRLGHVEASVEETRAHVTLQRKRRQACEVVRGHVAGAFECAWGQDVEVRHDACHAKEPCRYDVQAVRPERRQ